MRKTAMVAATAALLAGCGAVHAGQGSGSRTFNLRGFDRVSLRGADNVVVRVGGAASISATGPSAVLDKLELTVVNGELRVGRQRGNWNWGPNAGTATITVSVPRLRAASVVGSGDVLRGGSARCRVSKMGSGDVRCGG